MAILGRTGRTYARLTTHSGPRIDVELPTRVDWAAWPDDLAMDAMPFDLLSAEWHSEYAANIVANDQYAPAIGRLAGGSILGGGITRDRELGLSSHSTQTRST